MANVQFARLTAEATFNTYNSMGATTLLFLTENNDQTVRPMPDMYKIRDAGVANRLVRQNTGFTPITGNIQTYLFPSQAAAILGYASTLSGSPCYNLGSFTLDHVLFVDACLGIYRRYTGCKIAKLSLKGDSSAQGQVINANFDIIASTPRTITISDFATPAYGSYPSDDPYLFLQSAGNFTIGTLRADYTNFNVDITNMVKAFRGETIYASRVNFFGRDVTFGANLLLKNNTDRADYEVGTAVAASLLLDNGVDTLTLQFGNITKFETVGDAIPLDDYYMQQVNLVTLMDAAQSPPTDFSFTYGADS